MMWLAIGCHKSQQARTAAVAEMSAPPASYAVEPVCCRQVSRGELRRTVDGGLGRFFQTVHVSPAMKAQKFIGFRLENIATDSPVEGLALEPGDIVTRVNGSSIDRPEQALSVWSRLADGDQIVIDFLHGDAPRSTTIPIVDP
ncbi:MAG: hypothetical protein R3A47_02035 [Polyangiales bacterium]